MNKDMEKSIKEDILSDFIDDLNNEKRPRVYGDMEGQDDEDMLELLETVRAVKRLRGKTAEGVREKQREKTSSRGRFINIRRTMVAAVALVIVFFAGSLAPWRPLKTDKAENNIASTADNRIANLKMATLGDNVVYAMERAYEELRGYSGKIELITMTNGKVDFKQEIEIKYEKPGRYYFVEAYDNSRVVKISNGEKLYTIDSRQVTIDYVHPEKELWRFHIGDQIEELQRVVDIREAGKEAVAGRDATIYEFRYSEAEPVNRIWVDDKTKLPLMLETNDNENRKLVKRFTEIQFNPGFDDNQFTYTPGPEDKVTMINKKAGLEDVKRYWNKAGEILGLLEGSMKPSKAVKLEEGWYEYSLSFRGEGGGEYMDVYIGKPMSRNYFENAQLGRLKDGWVEVQYDAVNVFKIYIGRSNSVKWVTKDREVVMIGNIGTDRMIGVLENIAGEKLKELTAEDIKKFGIEPVYTKEGH